VERVAVALHKVAALYKRLYQEVKKVSPQTKVFVSFQWDYFQIMANREPKRISEHRKLIEIFRPELDVVAFTSYPGDRYKTPADVPANYYERISEYIKPTDEIHFMEIGWPTSGSGPVARRAPDLRSSPGSVVSQELNLSSRCVVRDCVSSVTLEKPRLDVFRCGDTQDGVRKLRDMTTPVRHM
jgi:hypothetical protein